MKHCGDERLVLLCPRPGFQSTAFSQSLLADPLICGVSSIGLSCQLWGRPSSQLPGLVFLFYYSKKENKQGGNILIHNQLTRPLYGWRAPPPITQYTEVRVLCFFPSRFPGSLVRHVPHPSRFLFSLHSKKFPAPKPSDSRFYAGPRNLPDVPLNNLQ